MTSFACLDEIWTSFKNDVGTLGIKHVLLFYTGCLSSPCFNGGDCIGMGTHGFYCICNNGYCGKQCRGACK